jgi:hypothetical protein
MSSSFKTSSEKNRTRQKQPRQGFYTLAGKKTAQLGFYKAPQQAKKQNKTAQAG